MITYSTIVIQLNNNTMKNTGLSNKRKLPEVPKDQLEQINEGVTSGNPLISFGLAAVSVVVFVIGILIGYTLK